MNDLINPGAGTQVDAGQDSGSEYEGAFDGNQAVNGPDAQDTPAQGAPTAEPATATPATTAEQQLEYVYQGKKVALPLSKAILKLQQAHVLDEKFRAFNEEKATIDKLKQELEPLLTKYKTIDEWATQNDDVLQRIVAERERQQQMQGLPGDLDADDPLVKANLYLANRLNKIEETVKEREEREQLQRQEAENQRAQELLDSQISEVKKEFPEINLDATDEAGTRLETAVIRHGLENNLPFREAFLSLFHKEIIRIAKEQGEKAALENIKRKNELGIVSTGGATRKEAPKRTDFKSVSWDQLIQEAKAEYLR